MEAFSESDKLCWEHSAKDYADNVTWFPATSMPVWLFNLRTDLSFKPVKCVSAIRSITEGGIKLLWKLIDVLLSVAMKIATYKHMIDRLTKLLLATDTHGEFRSIEIHSVLHRQLHLLPKMVNLPQSTKHVILYCPWTCCPNISQLQEKSSSSSCHSSMQPQIASFKSWVCIYTWEKIFYSFKAMIISSCMWWLLESNSLLFQLLNLCMWKLRINCWIKSSPPVRIIFKCMLSVLPKFADSAKLETLEPIIVWSQISILINCHFFDSFRYITNCNKFVMVEYSVQCKMYTVWFFTPYYCSCLVNEWLSSIGTHIDMN